MCYSRHDEALVKPLAGLLGVGADDAVFLDVASLKPGDLWDDKIMGAVKEASVFVLCWCCESEHSTFIAKEISAALSQGVKRLVPVLFCSTPLPPNMADRQWIDLRGQIVHNCPVPHVEKKKGPTVPRQQKMNRVRSRPGNVSEESDEEVPWSQDTDYVFNRSEASPMSTASAPSPASVGKGTRKRWITILSSAIVLAFSLIGLLLFSGPKSRSASPSVEAPHSLAREAPHTSAHHPHHLALTMVGVVSLAILVSLLFLLKRGLRSIRKRHDRLQVERVAATVTSYFEGLGKQ